MRQQQGKCTSLPETKLHFFNASYVFFCFTSQDDYDGEEQEYHRKSCRRTHQLLLSRWNHWTTRHIHQRHLTARDPTICKAPVKSRARFACNTISTTTFAQHKHASHQQTADFSMVDISSSSSINVVTHQLLGSTAFWSTFFALEAMLTDILLA